MDRTGLVLEGGAMRGLFSAGIMDVFLENGLRFDGIIGVSAGAAFGCNYKSGQSGRVLRYNKRFCRDKRYCSLYSLLTTGDLFGADFCYHQLPDELDPFDCRTYNQDPAEFYTVCTDVNTGQPHYQSCPTADAECFEWMRASASMPLVSRIVHAGNGQYLDGAIADSIPVKYFQTLGYSKNVVILTQPEGYKKQPQKAFGIMQLLLRKYPALLNAIKTRQIRYNQTLSFLEQEQKKGTVFILRPQSALPIGRICHDPEKLQQTYDIGRENAKKNLHGLRRFLTAQTK